MQKRKSQRHVHAANARLRAALERAESERQEGIPDREPPSDCREVLHLDLRSYGGKRLRIEPRLGYVSARAIDEDTGDVVHCAAMKELLHKIADSLPRAIATMRLD